MFGAVMSEPKRCKPLLEYILGVKIKKIEYPELQKVIDKHYGSKAVRLDVYVADDKGTVYNIELQATRQKYLPKRIRYYGGLIDLNIIEPGDDYNKLKESYVIFICPFDAFGCGLHRYTFEYLCRENPALSLGDGTRKIFLCAEGTADDVSPELGSFLNYIAGRNTCGQFVDRLESAVEKARRHDEWRLEFMTLEMKYREKIEEGRQAGLAEGRTAERQDLLVYLVSKNLLSKSDAAAAAGVSEQEFETWLEQKKQQV